MIYDLRTFLIGASVFCILVFIGVICMIINDKLDGKLWFYILCLVIFIVISFYIGNFIVMLFGL